MKNRIEVYLKKVTLVEVTNDQYINIGGDDKRKIDFIVSANGEHPQNDELQICAWGKAAERILDNEDGEVLDLKCNVSSRWIDKANGEGQFVSTELTCFFVEKHKEEKRGEFTERTQSANGRASGNGRASSETDKKKEQHTTNPRVTGSGRTGNGRSGRQ